MDTLHLKGVSTIRRPIGAFLDELAGFRQGGFVAEEAARVKVDVRQLRRMGPRSAICHAASKSARAPSASLSRNRAHFLIPEDVEPSGEKTMTGWEK
jgi:hypothetical protein